MKVLGFCQVPISAALSGHGNSKKQRANLMYQPGGTGAQPIGAGVITLEMSFKRQRDIDNEKKSAEDRLERSKKATGDDAVVGATIPPAKAAVTAPSEKAISKPVKPAETPISAQAAIVSKSPDPLHAAGGSSSKGSTPPSVAVEEHNKVLDEKRALEERLRRLEEQHAALKKQSEAAVPGSSVALAEKDPQIQTHTQSHGSGNATALTNVKARKPLFSLLKFNLIVSCNIYSL